MYTNKLARLHKQCIVTLNNKFHGTYVNGWIRYYLLCLHGIVAASVDFSVLYFVSKVSEKLGIGPPLLYI